jgi:hypothetical protein
MSNLPSPATALANFKRINEDCLRDEPEAYRAIENTPDCIEYYAQQLYAIYEDEGITEEQATSIATEMVKLS